MSGYILRELGADSCFGSSLMGSSRVDRSMCVGVVNVIVAAGAEETDGAELREDWLAARARRRDNMDGMASFQM